MRTLILATTAALILGAPIVTSAQAEETTVIKKDNDFGRSKTIIKKDEPSTTIIKKREPADKKVIIHRQD
jgi:hypothetical protein